MKNRLFSLLFAGIMGVLAVHAQTDYAKLGIERKVLFTMNKNEICTSVDTRNHEKGVNNIKFEMHVKDTIKGIYTYVFNGERILSNESTIVTAHEDMEDAPVRDSLILRYETKDGCYINFGKETYGPYKQIYPQDWNKFVYVLDNGYYMHDADGMIYQLSAGIQGRTFFQSPNKKHTALVSSDNVYKIRLDNTLYTLDSVKNGFDEKNKNIADVYVFDDGSCVVGYGRYFKGDDMGVDYEFYGYVDEEFYPEELVTLADTVSYENLIPGHVYELSGTIVKTDGSAFTPAGLPLTSVIRFIPESTEGTVDVEFRFNASSLQKGDQLVVFENLYFIKVVTAVDGQSVEKKILLTSHEDLSDEGQTVTVKPWLPKTGEEDSTGNILIGLIAICVGGAIAFVVIKKKKDNE